MRHFVLVKQFFVVFLSEIRFSMLADETAKLHFVSLMCLPDLNQTLTMPMIVER